MSETSLEQLVEERQFAGILQTHGEVFFRLSNTLVGLEEGGWNKKHYFQLFTEADILESFLDDYGARFNRTYSFLTELVASIRGFAQGGYAIAHVGGRLDSYGCQEWLGRPDCEQIYASLKHVRDYIYTISTQLVISIRGEAQRLGVELTREAFPESNFLPVVARRRLPRNLGEEDLVDEEQKIAEVAAKYLQACDMLAEIAVRRIDEPAERREFLARVCTEEQARVYEATIHNLQSMYDTHIQNTVLEGSDDRLPRLRGHLSVSLHFLASVTFLTHFFERHEDDIRSDEAKHRIGEIVSRDRVQDVILNHLLYWADRLLQLGRSVAADLLPTYMNVQELEVELTDDVQLHARPAALIVGIVNHHGTPVEMEVAGQRSNAASILELLVSVGSHPNEKRFVFRGDENPLRDIRLLFEHGLGEKGVDDLPDDLGYLRSDG
ncbi:MAG: HPr family phosphocarrier protein [Planctomycetota bacterium]|nr:HPr family phosphocarrier protein [Planctomycetota bacterium]